MKGTLSKRKRRDPCARQVQNRTYGGRFTVTSHKKRIALKSMMESTVSHVEQLPGEAKWCVRQRGDEIPSRKVSNKSACLPDAKTLKTSLL